MDFYDYPWYPNPNDIFDIEITRCRCIIVVIDHQEESYKYARKILKCYKATKMSTPLILIQNKIDLISDEKDHWINKMKQQFKKKNLKLHEICCKSGYNVKTELDEIISSIFIKNIPIQQSFEKNDQIDDEVFVDESLIASKKKKCLSCFVSFLTCDN